MMASSSSSASTGSPVPAAILLTASKDWTVGSIVEKGKSVPNSTRSSTPYSLKAVNARYSWNGRVVSAETSAYMCSCFLMVAAASSHHGWPKCAIHMWRSGNRRADRVQKDRWSELQHCVANERSALVPKDWKVVLVRHFEQGQAFRRARMEMLVGGTKLQATQPKVFNSFSEQLLPRLAGWG